MSTQQKGSMKFISHRPKDKLDPGFRIVGHKLRWIASTQTEDKMGRIWRVLRKEDMPAETLKEMQAANRDMFGRDNTIRNRELVLAYATEDAVNLERQSLQEAAKRQLSMVNSKSVPGGNKHITVDEAEMTKVSGSEFFNN
jgi:uncharacterized protein (DUF2252 family)